MKTKEELIEWMLDQEILTIRNERLIKEFLDSVIQQAIKQYISDEQLVTPEEANSMIQTAISEHEAGKWKKYPENKPKRDTFYLCSIDVFNGMVIEYDYYDGDFHNSRGDIDKYIIAFRELPEPFKPDAE